MQGSDSEARKPGTEFFWLHGSLLEIMSRRAGAQLRKPDRTCSSRMTHPTFRHEAMATYFEIAIAGQQQDYARQAAAAAFRELDRLENTLSRYIESSDISRANRLARGETTTIEHDTLECLLIAADV